MVPQLHMLPCPACSMHECQALLSLFSLLLHITICSAINQLFYLLLAVRACSLRLFVYLVMSCEIVHDRSFTSSFLHLSSRPLIVESFILRTTPASQSRSTCHARARQKSGIGSSCGEALTTLATVHYYRNDL